VVCQPVYLRHLIEIVSSDRVRLGTDYPFDKSEGDPLGVRRDATEVLPTKSVMASGVPTRRG
jgi:predicted TIM-barrel fold metal-dependent hydrolase